MRVGLEPGTVVLASGHLAEVSTPGGPRPRVAILIRCPWLVQVASGNPEPDFPEDCWKLIECGAPMREDPPDGRVCDHGHTFGNLEREWAPGGSEWQREVAERDAPRDRVQERVV